MVTIISIIPPPPPIGVPPPPPPAGGPPQPPPPPLPPVLTGVTSIGGEKLCWKTRRCLPCKMLRGAAVGNGSVGYFSPGTDGDHGNQALEAVACFKEDSQCGDVYAYDLESDDWSELPKCPSTRFGLAVVNNLVTAVGGMSSTGQSIKHLYSFSGGKWEKIFPAMPNKRYLPAVVTAQGYLIAAGGKEWRGVMSTVEVMNMDTLEWYTAASLPEPVYHASATVCEGRLYILGGKSKNGANQAVFTCTLDSLLRSCHPPSQTPTNASESSIWQRVADVPVVDSAFATLNGRVMAVGRKASKYSSAADVRMYDADSDSWPVVKCTRKPHSECLVVGLGDCVIVVRGRSVEVGYSGVFCSLKFFSSYVYA